MPWTATTGPSRSIRAHDQPTDAYLEGFAFWGLAYLDAQSWRHYLPRLIDYALRRPDDPGHGRRGARAVAPAAGSLPATARVAVTGTGSASSRRFWNTSRATRPRSGAARGGAAGARRVVAADPTQPAHARGDRGGSTGAGDTSRCATAACIDWRSPRHSPAAACVTFPRSPAAWRPGVGICAATPTRSSP